MERLYITLTEINPIIEEATCGYSRINGLILPHTEEIRKGLVVGNILGMKMIQHPWRNIVFGLILIYLGWSLGGFFKMNYAIGIGGILLGLWGLWKKK